MAIVIGHQDNALGSRRVPLTRQNLLEEPNKLTN